MICQSRSIVFMSDKRENTSLDDLRREIRQRKAALMANLLEAEKATLERHWDNIHACKHRTKEAEAYLTSGMTPDYFLTALREMAAVKAEAEQSIRELVNLLVQDLNIAGTTVAGTAHISHTTVNRWLDPERSSPND